jgi:hypothetical protein
VEDFLVCAVGGRALGIQRHQDVHGEPLAGVDLADNLGDNLNRDAVGAATLLVRLPVLARPHCNVAQGPRMLHSVK